MLAHWPTTTTTDAKASRSLGYGGQQFMTLTDAARASWATPMRDDAKVGTSEKTCQPAALSRQAHGLISPGSPAETAKPGQLNGEFSLFLMGYNRTWLMCAPSRRRP